LRSSKHYYDIINLISEVAVTNSQPYGNAGFRSGRNVGDEFPDLRGKVSQYRDEILLFNWEEEIAIEGEEAVRGICGP